MLSLRGCWWKKGAFILRWLIFSPKWFLASPPEGRKLVLVHLRFSHSSSPSHRAEWVASNRRPDGEVFAANCRRIGWSCSYILKHGRFSFLFIMSAIANLRSRYVLPPSLKINRNRVPSIANNVFWTRSGHCIWPSSVLIRINAYLIYRLC